MPEKPIEELWVALMGPAVNVVIGGLLLAYPLITNTLVPVDQISVGSGSFVERLMVANFFLVVFNILPAFPMDGGRVLRALLAMRLDYVRATQVAAFIGQGMAFVLGFIGLFGNPFLLFIALFVWIEASQEGGSGADETQPGRHSRDTRHADRFQNALAARYPCGRGRLIPADYIHRDPFGNGQRYWIDRDQALLAMNELHDKIRSGSKRLQNSIVRARNYVEERKWEIAIDQLEKGLLE